MTRFHVMIADDVDPAAVLKRGWTSIKELSIVAMNPTSSINEITYYLGLWKQLPDGWRVVRVWPTPSVRI